MVFYLKIFNDKNQIKIQGLLLRYYIDKIDLWLVIKKTF